MDHVKKNRVYSLLGQRGTFGTVLKDAASCNDRIVALSADLTRASGLEQFASAYPERFYNVGIAEENAVGMAAGLADQGYIPFVTTFANFAALRANEFVRHFMGYMKCNVKLVGLSAGFAMELFGNTHYGLEDIAVLRSIPNIEILSPADGLEVAKCVEYAAEKTGPVYIRLTGKMNAPIVYKQEYDFIPGHAVQLAEGEDVVFFATGGMVSIALQAAKLLAESGVSASVYDFNSIKPIDCNIIDKSRGKQIIVTVEEHSIIGGLGSAVAEELSKFTSHGKLLRLGTGDEYKAAGTYEYMLSINGLTAEKIKEKVIMSYKGE